MRSRGAPASSAIFSSWARWSMASAMIVVRACARRVVAQWMWLSVSSWRSARCGEPWSRKRRISGKVGYSAEHKQPRHREGAAGVGVGAAGLERLVAQPAAQEAGHEGVAGAEHVVDLDRKARALDAVLDRSRGSRPGTPRSPSARASSRSSPRSAARIARKARERIVDARRRSSSPPRCRRSGRRAARIGCRCWETSSDLM